MLLLMDLKNFIANIVHFRYLEDKYSEDGIKNLEYYMNYFSFKNKKLIYCRTTVKMIHHGSIEEIYKREFDILNKYTRNQLLDPFFIETKLDEILNEYDKPYNEGMKIFAHHSDYDGELTPEESGLVLKSFNRVNPDNFKKLDVYYNTWC